jgi:O-antigen/teichoic acid export membrane protein
MGIVLKQSFKNLVSTYAGFGLGAINVLFLYPNFMRPEYYGLVSFVLSASMLFWPLMALGTHNTLVKFYSSFTNQEDKERLFSFVLLLPLAVGLVLGLIGYFGYSFILSYFNGENELVKPYAWLIFVITFAMAYFELFFSWSKVFLKSTFGNIMREVFHRACIMILLGLLYINMIDIPLFLYLMTAVYVFRTLIMMVFAFKLHLPKVQFKLPANASRVIKYSALIFIAGSVAMMLLDLDKVMIEYYLPIENVAIYGISIYIASVIAVPSRAMHQITYPLTAQLLNDKDTKGLKDLYQRSSNTLLIVGGLIFLLIICNVRELYEMIPEDYHIGFSIVILIGIVKLYENLIGNNNSILFNSDYYRLVLAIGVLCAVMAVVFNMILIPVYGVHGASYATFIAFFTYNTVKLVVVWKKFKMHPFSTRTWVSLGLITIFSISFYFWDFSFHPLLNIALKSVILGIAFVGLAWKLKLSNDVSNVIDSFIKR